MRSEFLMALMELLEYEVRSRKVGDGIVVGLGNAHTDKATKGAVVRLPDVVCFGVQGGVGLGQSTFQPFGESKAIALHLELEAPLLPIGLREVKAEIGGPSWIRHETFADHDVTSGGDGM